MKNSSERHTSHEAGLMNADDVVVTYAKLSTKRKVSPNLLSMRARQGSIAVQSSRKLAPPLIGCR